MTTHRNGAQERATRLNRRQLLLGLAATGLVACMPRGIGRGGAAYFGIADPAPFPGIAPGLFSLGVASGDPTPDGFVLWTRLAPDPLQGGGMPDRAVSVRWQIARDAGFGDLVADGVAQTSAAVAHSLHIDVTGLPSAQTYYYRFTTGGQVSPVGTARTTPASDATAEGLRLAVATCQHYEQGYYTAWSQVAADQPDVVVFLGDYIYEGGISSTKVRRHNSAECTTLAAYRNRYALYKSDPNLQAAHAAAPWILTWDDHEVDNNYAGPVAADGTAPAQFAARRAAAYQAYWEHQPLRVEPVDDFLQLHRSIQWGTLADIMVLDGRQFRSPLVCGPYPVSSLGPDCADRTDPARTMLGGPQRTWLVDRLGQERATWSLLANQTVMTPMPIGTLLNQDQWDGYPVERSAVLDSLAQVRNAVVLTGDIHAAGVGLLRDESPTDPVVGTELISTSISSAPGSQEATLVNQAVGALPQFPYFNALERGYLRAEITAEHMDVDFVTVGALTPGAAPVIDRAYRIIDGQPGVSPR